MPKSVVEPKVTVLMPVYNALPFLRTAIDSILGQTFAEFELLLVDDGSTDGSAELIDSYHDRRLVVIRNEQNLGLSETLNKGLQLARGELIARMDADDVALPDRLAVQCQEFQSDSSLTLLGTAVTLINELDQPFAEWQYPLDSATIRVVLRRSSGFAHPSVMYRKSQVVAIGGYDGRFNPAEDHDLWMRLCARHVGRNLPFPLLRYRIHTSNMSTTDVARAVVASLAIQHDLRRVKPSVDVLREAGISQRRINDALLQTYLFWVDLYRRADRHDIVNALLQGAAKIPVYRCSLRLYAVLIKELCKSI